MLVTSGAAFLFAIVSCFTENFNALKCAFAGVFCHPHLEVAKRHQLPLTNVERGEICPAQKVVGSGSGDVEVGLQVFCGQDIRDAVGHIYLLFYDRFCVDV